MPRRSKSNSTGCALFSLLGLLISGLAALVVVLVKFAWWLLQAVARAAVSVISYLHRNTVALPVGNRPRVSLLALSGLASVFMCLCCFAYGAFYSTTPGYKAAVTSTALYRVMRTDEAISRATEVVLPSNTPEATATCTDTPVPSNTATPISTAPIATFTGAPRLTVTQTKLPTRTPMPTAILTRAPTWTPVLTKPLPTWTPRPLPTATAVIVVAPTSRPPGGGRVCCKICTTSKACGDSCIAKNKTCHQPPGCACDG